MRLAIRLPALVLALAVAACTDGTAPDSRQGVPVLFSVNVPAAVSAAETTALQSAFDRVDSYVVTLRDGFSGAVLASDTVGVPAGSQEHRFDLDLSPDLVGLAAEVTVVALEGGLELYRGSASTTIQAGTGSVAPVILEVRYSGPGIRGIVADSTGAGLGGVAVGLYQSTTLIATATAEPDGTYLFLNVGTGLHSVEPTPPPSLFVCPAGRSVNVAAGAAIIADFTALGTPCQVDLLVLSGGDVDNTSEVAGLFANTPGVTTATYFYVNQTPGLNALRQYDVVLLFTDGIFDETTALGDELARYVEVGGNLVIGSFYWQGRSDSQFTTPGWGGLESMDPFLADTVGVLEQGGATYEANDLGTVALPSHPLIQGVSSLVSFSGFGAGVLAKPSTTVVASWTDGAPLVGYRVLQSGQRIVAVSLFPAADNPTQVTGDVQTLWQNAVVWAGNAGGPIP